MSLTGLWGAEAGDTASWMSGEHPPLMLPEALEQSRTSSILTACSSFRLVRAWLREGGAELLCGVTGLSTVGAELDTGAGLSNNCLSFIAGLYGRPSLCNKIIWWIADFVKLLNTPELLLPSSQCTRTVRSRVGTKSNLVKTVSAWLKRSDKFRGLVSQMFPWRRLTRPLVVSEAASTRFKTVYRRQCRCRSRSHQRLKLTAVVRSQRSLWPAGVPVQCERVCLRTLAEETDQFLVGEVGEILTITRQQFVTRLQTTVGDGGFLDQSLDRVLQHRVVRLAEREAETAVNFGQTDRKFSVVLGSAVLQSFLNRF